MKIEDQVCSLELAKKLKELGVEQEVSPWPENLELKRPASIFVYVHPWQNTKVKENKSRWVIIQPLNLNGRDFISAFTVAELIIMLQDVAKEDILVALDDKNVADTLAKQLCTKLQDLKESAGSGRTH